MTTNVNIIHDTAEATKFLDKMVKAKASYHNDLKSAALTSLYHITKHGNAALLNRFYNEVLTTAYQSPFRAYLGRHAKEVLVFQNGLFAVKKGVQEQRDALIKKIEEELIQENSESFYETSTRTEGDDAFDPVVFLNRMDTAIKLADRYADELGDKAPKIKEIFQKLRKELEVVIPDPKKEETKKAA